MNTKKVLISFLAIATLLFLVATVSAAEITADATVEINGVEVQNAGVSGYNISVIAGETISVKISFTSDVDASNVRIEADLEADRESVDAVTTSFDVKVGKRYVKILTLEVPYELNDELSDDVTLDLKILNGDDETDLTDIVLTAQRPSYSADIMSIIVSNSIEAGQISPVDIVLKNVGYNDLEDLYVTVRISDLGISKTAYFGDLVAVQTDDDKDTISKRIYLEVPYDVSAGIYTLEVAVVGNDGFSNIVEKQIAVQNGFPEVGIKSGSNLLVLNPSNQLKVYRIVYPAEEVIVDVQAGSSKLVPIQTEASGEYNFDVFIYSSGNELVGTVNFAGVDKEELTSPIVLLTVILGIIFLVLLVVLIVLITKKPQKTEEFGESYY